ncbi:MAG TPA: helix-turn-helix transcriptional regulator [Puia sp.]|nr:helix-turn-helix transcriptional regulator [Puia sp.]
MATTTLKILREVNDYTQEFVAEEILGISQTTYARLEQHPAKITAEQAQKLSDLYKVSIANLLSEATPVITFKQVTNTGNTNSANGGYFQSYINQGGESELTKLIQSQNELLLKQNEELLEVIKTLKEK